MNIKKHIFFSFVVVLFCSTVQANAPLLSIEGNIGVGKSTFLKILHKVLPYVSVVSEPVDEWQDISGHNLLDVFYKDGARWSCTFQLYALMTRVRKLQEHSLDHGALQFMERSWFSDRYCFAKNCLLLGMMTEMEWALYCGIWRWHAKNAPKPIGVIYLRAEPEVCYERMQSRARTEESIVPLDYLKMLHQRHEEWLVEQRYHDDELTNIPVLVLDASHNFRDDEDTQQRFAQQILDFLYKHENIDFTI